MQPIVVFDFWQRDILREACWVFVKYKLDVPRSLLYGLHHGRMRRASAYNLIDRFSDVITAYYKDLTSKDDHSSDPPPVACERDIDALVITRSVLNTAVT